MAKKKLVIISSDREYTSKIEYELAKRLSKDADIEIMTGAYLGTKAAGSLVHTMILDEGEQVAADHLLADHVLKLTSEEQAEFGKISKFGGVTAVLRALPGELLGKEDSLDLMNTKIIDVISVSGGSGRTLTSLAVASNLARKGRKVLYISTEPIQRFDMLMDGEVTDMSEYEMSCITGSPDTAASAVLASLGRNGFDYMAHIPGPLCMYQIADSHIYSMADNIALRRLYDYIVLEHATITAQVMPRIRKSDRLLITCNQSKDSMLRLREFLKMTGTENNIRVAVCGRYHSESCNALDEIEDQDMCPVCEYIPECEGGLRLSEAMSEGYFKRAAEAVE